jgi:hypothetical protein
MTNINIHIDFLDKEFATYGAVAGGYQSGTPNLHSLQR